MPLSSTRIVDSVGAKKESAPSQTANAAKIQHKESSAKPPIKEAPANIERKLEKDATTSGASNNNNNNENKTGKIPIMFRSLPFFLFLKCYT